MPMFQLPSWRRDGEIRFQNGGHVIELDLSPKIQSNGEKLDLRKMVDELKIQDVPSVFICPISLDPMLDPVTLCTGQTYERSNISRWFSMGHLTCPTTMQELWDDALIPNRTLYHLIYSWFSQKYLQMKKRSEDVQGRALELLEALKKAKGHARVQILKDLYVVIVNHDPAKKAVADGGGVSLICSLLGPFTSHALGSEAVTILVKLPLDSEARNSLMQPVRISLVIDMLNEGTFETKINCMKLIESLMEDKDFSPETVSSFSLLVGILRLIKDKRYPNGVSSGLNLLQKICLHKSVRNAVVSIGAVSQLMEMLPSLSGECLESALSVLDSLSASPEGLLALKQCSSTIPNLSKLLMRVPELCNQYVLSILWAVCKQDPDECGPIAVEAGLAAKLLLVMQSSCAPALKQRSAELLKLCSLNYSTTLFMSKCKLTTTIQ